MKLDKKDRKLLEVLQLNSRTTNAELAKQVGLSPSSTLERVKKLETSGLIDKYITLLNPRKAGYTCFTFVEVKLARHGETPVENFFNSIADMTEVLECHHITGEADFLLKIITKDIPAYEELILHQLSALPNVQNMKTSVVLSTFKNETKLVV
ncbi:MAG: Lrp/AsnC family transcriptional regulator [Candidatus Marinimicrobia bacterium]|jgi:DNA-binding Lrp family transcriptional regulator|nr:Lrp/AsnC family transcriptional regulator [Candidatus Neomarinimicrobiota bacterium]MBT3839215.1 Lrp/AsnC family transcriptional regulator [Candidatus Neomarinimicrobiota bacterium]MBT3999682.1 Lrp/AsnC family transcriptional regulator [Candidatus Neomarinimicrobiota bacterium]MBT4281967.1 Lrp/AsnC family transcriptional regulator [Candidatus Neomarinimicrobiota bacterium]MBT4579451.1 Lrp/AsnC family transcriptional regulator [Candidatus Neomarinimicrobiota bacterium]